MIRPIALVALLQAQPQATVPSGAYTHPQRLVAIDGSRRLNLFCLGTGAPVILLDAGAGENMMVWRHVQQQLAAVTRTCAYDRAGYGFSDSSTRASDASNAVDDLHRLIETARLAPLIYVGHSIAGLYGSLLVAKYGSEVAGMVLIDPAFPHQFRAMAASYSPAERTQMVTNTTAGLKEIGACLDLARQGALAHPTTATATSCVETKGYAEPLDDTLRRELERQYARPRLMSAALSEYGSFWPTTDAMDNVDDRELDAVHIDFGDRPLVVLTKGNANHPLPGISPAHTLAGDTAWMAGHDSLAMRSTRGSNTVVAHTDHHIQFDQPAAVIDAAIRVVSEVRVPQDSVVASRMTTLFHALGTGDSAELRRTVTSDFYLFEHARWNVDTLLRLMPAVRGRRWSLDKMRVTVAEPLAYVTYENHSDGAPIYWLESAVLRHTGGTWRIAFMHSTRMPLPTDTAGLTDWQPMGNGGYIMRLVGSAPPSPTEMTAFRVRYPANIKADSGVHYHLGTEHATILKGTLMVGFGDTADYSKMKAYGPGSFLVIPAGTHHYEVMRGEVEAQIEAVGPMTTIWLTHAGP